VAYRQLDPLIAMLALGIIPSLNMDHFSRFFAHRATLLIWNHSLIHFPIVAKDRGFLCTGGPRSQSMMAVLKTNVHNSSTSNTGVCSGSTGFGMFQEVAAIPLFL